MSNKEKKSQISVRLDPEIDKMLERLAEENDSVK